MENKLSEGQIFLLKCAAAQIDGQVSDRANSRSIEILTGSGLIEERLVYDGEEEVSKLIECVTEAKTILNEDEGRWAEALYLLQHARSHNHNMEKTAYFITEAGRAALK